MGWEQHGKYKYYYRAKREYDRIVKQYFGRSETARMQAAIDDVRRKERRAAQAARQKEKERLDKLDEGVEQLCELADLVAHLALTYAGYHRHNKGEWRKRRVPRTNQRRRTKRGPRRKPGPKKRSSTRRR